MYVEVVFVVFIYESEKKNRKWIRMLHKNTRTKKRGNTAGIKLIHCNAATRLIALKLCHQYKSGRYMVVGCFSRIECLIF